MKIKAIASALIAILHIIVMVWYNSQDAEWLNANNDIASFLFFGVSFILIGSNMFIGASNTQFPIQLEISKFHSIFICLLGTIYALHYSGLMLTTHKERLVMICAGVLLIMIIIVVSAWRHGFFKRETYEL